MPKPLNTALNIAVNQIASQLFPKGYDISDQAPNTYEALCAHIDGTGRMCVWSGASDQTIFADPETNYAFRAWHDWHHYKAGLDFTMQSEKSVCALQQRDIVRLYGSNAQSRAMQDAIWAEVAGQAEHLDNFGEFPVDQMGFVRAWLDDGPGVALTSKW